MTRLQIAALLVAVFVGGMAAILARGAQADALDDLVALFSDPPPPTIVHVQAPATVCGFDAVRIRLVALNTETQAALIECGEYVDGGNYIRTCLKASGYVVHPVAGNVVAEPITYPPEIAECLPVPAPTMAQATIAGILGLVALGRRHG